MLETIREYALEKLSGTEDVERVARRHAILMCEIAEKAAPNLAGPDQVRWANRQHRSIAIITRPGDAPGMRT